MAYKYWDDKNFPIDLYFAELVPDKISIDAYRKKLHNHPVPDPFIKGGIYSIPSLAWVNEIERVFNDHDNKKKLDATEYAKGMEWITIAKILAPKTP